MSKRKFILLISCLIWVFVQKINAQNFSQLRGIPFQHNYLPQTYQAHEKNFDIIQSTDGIMYFANFAGILEFDGSTWNKINTSSGMRVVSLAKNREGKIYAGGLYDFGYLERNVKGISNFTSLAGKSDLKDISLIFKVFCIDNKTYFISGRKIYINNGIKNETILFENEISSAFEVNQQIFLFFDPQNEKAKYSGLYLYANKNLVKINTPENTALMEVRFMIPFQSKTRILLGSANQGMFVLQNNTLTEYETEINTFIKNRNITSCIAVSSDNYAVGTDNGVILFNNQGKLLQTIDQISGLNDESINALYLDKNNSLWIATNNGISKAEINWPLSYIDNKSSGLEGKVQDINFFNNKIYIATDRGLYFLENSSISKYKNLNAPCMALLVHDNTLCVGTSRGIFSLNEKNTLKQIQEYFTFCIFQSKQKNKLIYTGHNRSVRIHECSGDNLKEISTINNIQGDVTKIAEDEDGCLFFEVTPGRIYIYNPSTKILSEVAKESGLLSPHLNVHNGKVFISSEKGLFQVNRSNFEYRPYFILPGDTGSYKIWLYDLFKLSDSNSIFTDGEQKNLKSISFSQKQLVIDQTPFLPLADFSIKSIWYNPQTQQIWAGGKDGIFISNQNEKVDYTVKFKTIIRRINLLNRDSLIDLDENKQHKIHFSNNSLLLEFSVPAFPVIGTVKYRYFLKGFDPDTSIWLTANKKEYTNLPAGQYEFIVEAQNEFGQKALCAQYKFKILTPIWRRWWALIIYLAILIMAGRWFVIWRMKNALKEKERLEALVKERTEEIERNRQKIEEQRDIAYRHQKEILDSISYAQRIQQAVLPSQQYAEDILLEHFILYRPRDIVSGDFYWMKKINNYVAVVAADCTGHGVPGAFMSMLGSSFLNEIVTRRSLDNAAQILNRLRNKVKKSLHQEGKEGEQKDGMDIALFIIDSETLDLQYAGAYNPLYIIRINKNVDSNDESIDLETRFEFIQLKADRQPIGIHLNEKDFTNHVFRLQNGDSLYSFSDGYVDQFGGETGEKFKHKRFKDLLLSVQGKSMMEQKKILEQTFVRWKRDLAQIDDVLVLGIKV